MANLLGTNLGDEAVPFADNGKTTHYGRWGDHDKPVASIAARNALKVRPDGKLNTYNPNSSGQLGLGMTVTYPDGSKEMLKADMAWWTAAGRTEAQKVAALQTTLTAQDEAQPGKCWWEAVTGGDTYDDTALTARVQGAEDRLDTLEASESLALGSPVVARTNAGLVGYANVTDAFAAGASGYELNQQINLVTEDADTSDTTIVGNGGSISVAQGATLVLQDSLVIENLSLSKGAGNLLGIGLLATVRGTSAVNGLSLGANDVVYVFDGSSLTNCTGTGTIYLYDNASATLNAGGITVVDRRPGAASGGGGDYAGQAYESASVTGGNLTLTRGDGTTTSVPVGSSVADGAITNAKLATDVKVGSLASLTTTAKGSLVAAVNENTTLIGGAGALTAISAAFDEPVDSLADAIIYQYEDFTGYKAAAAKNQNYRVDLKANLPVGPEIGPGTIGRVYADTEANNGAYYVLPDGVTWAKNTQNATEAAKYYSAAEAINQASGYRSYDTPAGYSGGRRLFQSTNTGAPAAQAIPPLSATNVLAPGWQEISASVANSAAPSFWGALQKSASSNQTIDQALVVSEKKFTDMLVYPSTTQTDYPFVYFEACRITEIRKTDSISTVQYSVNGGSFTALTFTGNTSTPALNISAGAQLTWRVVFANGAASGQLQLKGTLI